MGTKLAEIQISLLQKLDLTFCRWRSIINKRIEKLKEEQRTEE